MFIKDHLTPSSFHLPESATPGSGRGEVIGGGAPLRYDFTSRAYHALSPWNYTAVKYSILQIALGSNPNSNLEVVSSLNLFNQARGLYHYNYHNCPSNYYPKLYLGTVQTIATGWFYDRQTYAGSDIKMPENWPLNGPQKGEFFINEFFN